MSAGAVERQPRATCQGLTGSAVIGAATVVLAVVAVFSVQGFATVLNLRGLLLAVSLVGITAVGLSLITIVGKVFTLSIPATIALSTITFASTLHLGWGFALLVTVAMATIVGIVQGVIVGRFQSDPIITTIAAAAILTGVGQLWTGGQTIVGNGEAGFLNSNVLGFVPVQAVAFAALTALLFCWHRFSVAGRKLTLLGLNDRAAYVAGLRSWPLVVAAFAISGAAAGVAAALLSAQSGQGTLLLGASFGFDAIVAVIIGGVGVRGGVGTPLSAAIGALFVGLLQNLLALIGLNYGGQYAIKGVLVLAAVVILGISKNRGRS